MKNARELIKETLEACSRNETSAAVSVFLASLHKSVNAKAVFPDETTIEYFREVCGKIDVNEPSTTGTEIVLLSLQTATWINSLA